MNDLPRNQILLGDAATRLRELPAQTVDTVMTSPPYFRLRDYHATGQFGLESSIDQWVDHLRAVMVELARVMVPTGTVWLNLGDAYATHSREGAARKSLLLGPERLAVALLKDGWIVRNCIVWAKTNPIPSSVSDRLSTTHEYVYLLTRSPRYYFDLHAIRRPHRSRPPKRRRTSRHDSRRPAGKPKRPAWLGPNSDADTGLATLRRAGLPGHPLGANPGDVWRLSTSRYRGAHFATYPESLVERSLLAGCPVARCVVCRRPWRRAVRRLGATATRLALAATCDCRAASEPGLVLDPFLGSGTTAVVAERLNLDWCGIELNPDFVALARGRIQGP